MSGSIDPVEFREVIHSVLRDPKALLVIGGAGSEFLAYAVSEALPDLRDRVYTWASSPLYPNYGPFMSGHAFNNCGSLNQLIEIIEHTFAEGTVVRELDASRGLNWNKLIQRFGLDFTWNIRLIEDIKSVMVLGGDYEFFDPEPHVEWSIHTHSLVSQAVREYIKVMLMIRKSGVSEFVRVPMEIMYEIFMQLQRLHWNK